MSAPLPASPPPGKTLAIVGFTVGVLLLLLPIVTVSYGIFQANQVLGSSGIGDPQALSTAIGHTLLGSVFSLMLLPVGILLIILSLIRFARLRRLQPPALPVAPPLA
jgi:hypothetical protein